LPFDDETFDAVCCFGALDLVPEPCAVAHEMVRVLRPGGRTAILTSYAGQTPPIRYALTAGAPAIGLTVFERDDFVDLFSSAGLVEIEQQTQRALQFVAAGGPAVNGQRKARLDGFDGYLLQVVLTAHISTLGRAPHEIRRRHACLRNDQPRGIALQELLGPDSGHPNGADPVALHQKSP
jgi:SAM-dependent methyltransferase